jgi:anti-sigma factor (TIGR02949 family)
MDRLDRCTCEEALRRLEDFLDRELAPEEMRRVQVHLDTCAACTSQYRFEAQLLDGLREKIRRISLPGELRERISRRLDEERRASNG